MLFKIIAFAVAAYPVILFVRSVLLRKPTRFSTALKEFKKEVDFAVYVFIGLVSCTIVYALGRLLWTWLSAA